LCITKLFAKYALGHATGNSILEYHEKSMS
jgi:hypothetical protein